MAVGATGIGDGFPTTSVKEVIPSERVKTESAGETNVVLTVVYRYPSFLSCRSPVGEMCSRRSRQGTSSISGQ